MPPRHRPSLRAPAAALAAAAIMLAGAAAASAHTAQEATVPADGARLRTAPAAVVVRYSEPVAAVVESSVRLDGVPLAGAAPARLSPDDASRVRIPLPASPGPGRVAVRWVVRSGDGHLIAGTLGFTVTGAPLDAGIERVAKAVAAAARTLRSITA